MWENSCKRPEMDGSGTKVLGVFILLYLSIEQLLFGVNGIATIYEDHTND